MSEPQNTDPAEPLTGWALVSKRSSRGRFFLVGLMCLALLVGVGVFVAVHSRSAASLRRQEASAAASTFLRTWASGDASALPAQTVTGSGAAAQAYSNLDGTLGIERV